MEYVKLEIAWWFFFFHQLIFSQLSSLVEKQQLAAYVCDDVVCAHEMRYVVVVS